MKKKTIASKVQSELSLERTVLANRRTFLSYFRSAVALLVAGAGLLKFVQTPAWVVIGWIFVAMTPGIMVAGILDYIHVKRLIVREREILEAQYGENEFDSDGE